MSGQEESGWGPPPVVITAAQPAVGPSRGSGNLRRWLFAAGATLITIVIVVGSVVVGVDLWRTGHERQRAEEREALFPDVPRPELREVPPVSAFGPTWEPGAATYVMAMPLWPFAFRTPSDWNCFSGGSYDPAPLAPFASCTQGMDLATPPRIQVLVWECATTCTEQERQDMIETWLDEPELAVAHERLPISYVESDQTDEGVYAMDLSYFAADPADPDGARWHIGVYFEASPEARDDLFRILNDIVSQTSPLLPVR